MKYVSIDIETTGLNPETCQVLSIGAVIEDTNNPLPIDKLPKFHAAIKRERIEGEITALTMNADLIKTINHYVRESDQDERNDIVQMTDMQFLDEDQIIIELFYFLAANGFVEFNPSGTVTNHKLYGVVPYAPSHKGPIYITVAGKNFGTFDLKFLEKLPRWKQLIKVRSRIIDPAILFVDWKIDESLPGLNLCKERGNIKGVVTHNALEDAIDVVAVLRTKYQ